MRTARGSDAQRWRDRERAEGAAFAGLADCVDFVGAGRAKRHGECDCA